MVDDNTLFLVMLLSNLILVAFFMIFFLIGQGKYNDERKRIMEQFEKERHNLFEFQMKEREELVKAILAKDLHDLTTSRLIEDNKDVPKELVKPDLISLDDMGDDEFNEAIKQQLET